jgi:hypothetical protein
MQQTRIYYIYLLGAPLKKKTSAPWWDKILKRNVLKFLKIIKYDFEWRINSLWLIQIWYNPVPPS